MPKNTIPPVDAATACSLPPLPPHRVESSYIAGTSARWWQVYLKEPLPNGGVALGQKGDTIKEARHLARVALAVYYARENVQAKR
jgi:hypothetical protein